MKTSVKFLLLGISLLLLSSAQVLADRKEVTVIGYDFPPYVIAGEHAGITFDFIDLLNKSQFDFTFAFRLTSANRRYKDFSSPQNDMILFEMPEWGWAKTTINYQASRQIAHGGEVYIAQARLNREQSYFDTLKDKTIAAIIGYHYGFAGFNSDQGWLYDNFSIHLGSSHTANIKQVDKGRVDVAIVTKAFLHRFLRQNPYYEYRLLISEKSDQEYHLRAMIKDDANITMTEFDKILDGLTKSGEMQKFQQKHKLDNH